MCSCNRATLTIRVSSAGGSTPAIGSHWRELTTVIQAHKDQNTRVDTSPHPSDQDFSTKVIPPKMCRGTRSCGCKCSASWLLPTPMHSQEQRSSWHDTLYLGHKRQSACISTSLSPCSTSVSCSMSCMYSRWFRASPMEWLIRSSTTRLAMACHRAHTNACSINCAHRSALQS